MTAATPSAADALAERLFGATLGALELFSVYLGVELGLYRTLERHGALTPEELADRAGIAPRYAREWLEQQAVAGLLDVVDAPSRRCALPDEHARVLCHEDDPAHIAPFAHMLAGIGGVLPRVAEAYRTGGGVPYEAYGVEFRHGQGHINRPAFTNELPGDWLEAMPDVVVRLRESGARVADVGCGQGWSSIAVARAFPLVQVDGFDADPASIADSRRHAGEAGVDDRVRFAESDAATLSGGPYDLVMILETLHDLPRPVDALRAARAATAPAAPCWWSTSVSPSPSPRPATRSSGRCTAGASRTACPRRWSTSRRPRWAPSCAPTRCASARSRPATPASTCCRSRTTSSASTASIRDVEPCVRRSRS